MPWRICRKQAGILCRLEFPGPCSSLSTNATDCHAFCDCPPAGVQLHLYSISSMQTVWPEQRRDSLEIVLLLNDALLALARDVGVVVWNLLSMAYRVVS